MMDERTQNVTRRRARQDPPDAAAQPQPRLPVPARPAVRHESAEEPEALGVYVISVTARILHMHPQTLRKYERLGLVRPSRSVGNLRYYSDHDLSRLRMIKHLVEERGMNLAGVELALELVGRLQGMQQALEAGGLDDVAESLETHLQAVLELLHFAAGERGLGDGPTHPR